MSNRISEQPFKCFRVVIYNYTVFTSLEKGGRQIDPASKQQMKFM